MNEMVAVVGSRDWKDLDAVKDYVNSLDLSDTIVSGGARGVDMQAQIAAEDRGMATIIFRPDWNTHGKRAGILRNMMIVDRADRVVAFWDGRSAGTKHSVEYALEKGKPVIVFKPEMGA